MTASKLTIRIHYPADGGRIRLRSDHDWEHDLEPVATDGAGNRFDFELPLTKAFHYFKPVLRRGDELSWSQGPDFLALGNGRPVRDVYPYFFADTSCSVREVQRVPSKDGRRGHAVRVFYPPGYAENTLKRYPVIYMQDGQNLFFAEEAFGGREWRIDETVAVLSSVNLIRKVIVVGVYPEDRMADYTAPGFVDYGRYLADDLKPWVDSQYRTQSGARNTAVMGSSLGGVVSFHLAWSHPEVFGMAGCLSSAFDYRDDLMARVAAEAKRPVRFYLDSGWPRDNYEVTRSMRNLLLSKGYREGVDFLYFAFPGERHHEDAWATRAHVPFQFFFGRASG